MRTAPTSDQLVFDRTKYQLYAQGKRPLCLWVELDGTIAPGNGNTDRGLT